MILHSHAMDVYSRAEDLASAILSSSTPPQISAACAAVEAFLRRHPHDQSRTFFSVAFPALICRLFGFDDSSSAARPAPPPPTGWVDQPDPEAAARVMDLMSPGGVLFSAIASADRQALVRYVFPLERLPEWMRWALLHADRCGGEGAMSDLCPLFRSRIRRDSVQKTLQLQLDAFQYFLFWFAYFPVCRGASDIAATGAGAVGFNATRKAAKRFRIENWTSAWPAALAAGKRRPGQRTECSLYLRLLHAYLRAFMPRCSGGSTPRPYRSSLLHYAVEEDTSVALQAEFMLHTFVHFWMVDNDFSPLSLSACKPFGISFPFRKILAEAPPTPGLGEPLKLLVRYLTFNSVTSAAAAASSSQLDFSRGANLGCWSTPRSPSFGAGSFKTQLLSYEQMVGPWNSLLQRPLYRFISRTFLFCPIGASMKNAAEVFSLWVTYLEPWKIRADDFREPDSSEQQKQDAVQDGAQNHEQGNRDDHYTLVWRNYVASNHLFYTSLVMHFLTFAHKFLHANAETIIPMVLKVVHVLASSDELVDFLKRIDAAYHPKSPGSSPFKDGSIKFVPAIREQFQDWEDGLCESLADGSSRECRNCDLQLFSEGDDGAQCLLQQLILRAESEIRALPGGNEQQLRQDLSSLRSGMLALFGGPVDRFLSPIATRSPSDRNCEREEVFTPKRQVEVKYLGDWMRRPVSDTEIAWLARHLVRLSDWLNRRLGLDRAGYDEPIGPTYIELPASNDLSKVHSAKDAVWIAIVTLVSWVMMSVQSVPRFLRRRGLRINLRILASKKVATALVMYVVISMVRRAVASILWT